MDSRTRAGAHSSPSRFTPMKVRPTERRLVLLHMSLVHAVRGLCETRARRIRTVNWARLNVSKEGRDKS